MKMVRLIVPKDSQGVTGYQTKDGKVLVPEPLAMELVKLAHGFKYAEKRPEVFRIDPISGRRLT